MRTWPGRLGEFEAVKGISFAVEEGEIFGLLGPNGGRQDNDDLNADRCPPTNRRYGTDWGFDVRTQMAEAKMLNGLVPQDPLCIPRCAIFRRTVDNGDISQQV